MPGPSVRPAHRRPGWWRSTEGRPGPAAQLTQTDESGIHTSGWVAPAAVQPAAMVAGSTALTVIWQSFDCAATVPTASAISGAAATLSAQPGATDVPVDPPDPADLAAVDAFVVGVAPLPAAVSLDPDRARIVAAPITAAIAITTAAARAAR